MIEIAGASAGTPAGAKPAGGNGAVNGAAGERVRAPADAAEASRAAPGPLQRAALAVLRGEWTTLAVVATHPAAPVQPLAAALAEVARAYRLRPVRVLDASAASGPALAQLQDELSAARGGDGRVAVAVDDPRASPAGAPLLVHVEAVVLVVRLGATALRAVEETVELVGRERVLGCVVAR
ncbi:MAG TPA: hypothetical protein VFL83_02125 [Anaeromyxobacter sp.]|nr:hypothetical protein [Anaeromyxobacter sp.]